MLKKFFVSMLGTMAALWLTLIIIGLGIVALVGAIAAGVSNDVKVAKENILHIELLGEIPERQADITFENIINYSENNGENLSNILNAIKLAANDNSIKGIFLDCKGSALGLASRSEIVEALKEFKKSGKFVIAYSDNYDQGDYYIATIADNLYLNPVGSINVHGLGTTTMFLKNFLDKIGVQIQVVKVGDFKSAVEPYIRTEMSEESKLQTTVFLTQIWQNVTNAIADNRGVKSEDINMWADSLSFTWNPQRYINDKLADALKYRSEVENILREKISIKSSEELPLLLPSDYMNMKANALGKTKSPHIAVYYAIGDIVDTGVGGIVGEKVVPEILDLAKDDNVKGLILRVNSGGGSAFASEQIWHALEDFKATGKPLYVSMGDYAASGGYYISCGANKIYADAATLTGSIGIFGIIPNAENLLTEKIGIDFQTVETNKDANFPTFIAPATQEQLQHMQAYVERGYETFTSRVAEGRNIPIDSVKAIGGGRVWDGMSALNIGLVDEIGSLNAAINAMAQELSLDAKEYVGYPPITDKWLELLFGDDFKLEGSGQLSTMLQMRDWLQIYNYVKNLSPLQARMEYITLQ